MGYMVEKGTWRAESCGNPPAARFPGIWRDLPRFREIWRDGHRGKSRFDLAKPRLHDVCSFTVWEDPVFWFHFFAEIIAHGVGQKLSNHEKIVEGLKG